MSYCYKIFFFQWNKKKWKLLAQKLENDECEEISFLEMILSEFLWLIGTEFCVFLYNSHKIYPRAPLDLVQVKSAVEQHKQLNFHSQLASICPFVPQSKHISQLIDTLNVLTWYNAVLQSVTWQFSSQRTPYRNVHLQIINTYTRCLMMEIMSISDQKKEKKLCLGKFLKKIEARVQLYGREFHLMRVEELLLINSLNNFLMGA